MILPWYNQLQIDFLEVNKVLLQDYSVFEYGSGMSTVYYANFVRKIVSIESRLSWFEKTKQMLISNNDIKKIIQDIDDKFEITFNNNNILLCLVQKDFANSILEYKNTFTNRKTFIVIDSNERAKCLEISTQIAKQNPKNTVIMLDNSERGNLQNSINNAISMGFYHKTFSSIRPSDNQVSTSTIFSLNPDFFIS